mgnify:FL=1|jgi:S-adenosylmethionine:tRNA ribosyltransferase-isomerase
MHQEHYHVPESAVADIRRTQEAGGRVVAVGTTVVRALESAALASGQLNPGSAASQLFITPGFKFNVVEALITNFHLPRSTLLMLVSAFAGVERIREAYAVAIEREYRFFSFGDAMFLQRDSDK